MTSELDVRRERAARNQSLFRTVNEQIEDIASPAYLTGFICECANPECSEQVSLAVEEYEQIRSHPNRFLVIDGHQIPDVEEIIETSDRFVVVAKLGTGGELAAELDPRSGAAA
jgi:hypothetical protein